MASISPQTIDLLIVMIFQSIQVLGKLSKGEEITEADLRLETWEETFARIKSEIQRDLKTIRDNPAKG